MQDCALRRGSSRFGNLTSAKHVVNAVTLDQTNIRRVPVRALMSVVACRLYAERQSLNLELIGVMLPAAIAVPGTTEQLPSSLQPQACAGCCRLTRHVLCVKALAMT